MFIRENKITVGENYMEVDIIPRTDNAEKATKGTRSRKQKVTRPAQVNLNDKNSKRYFTQIANGNFTKKDLHVSLTYSAKYLPKSVKEAEKEVTNFLRRVSYRRKKAGLEPLKYILVTEYKQDKDGKFTKRVHHHIIMNGGLSRDEIEEAWSKGRGRKKERIGFANTDRLQPDENGLQALTEYLTKDPQGKKRWSSSRNLKRPFKRSNDHKYSRRKIEAAAFSNDLGFEFFQKQYQNFYITEIKAKHHELTGWHIYLRMWKKERTEDFDNGRT